jgi:hypothetical protein
MNLNKKAAILISSAIALAILGTIGIALLVISATFGI